MRDIRLCSPGTLRLIDVVLCCVAETKKDPGIPNDFPYKDQILAEVAEQRRSVRGESLSRTLVALIFWYRLLKKKSERRKKNGSLASK